MTKNEIISSKKVKLTLCFLGVSAICAAVEIVLDFAGGRDASVYFVIDMITYVLMIATGLLAIISACIKKTLNIAIGVVEIVLGAFVIVYVIVVDALEGMWIVSDAAWVTTGTAFVMMGTSYIAKGKTIALVAAAGGGIAFVGLLAFELYFFSAYDMYEPTWAEIIYIAQYLLHLAVWILADMIIFFENRRVSMGTADTNVKE